MNLGMNPMPTTSAASWKSGGDGVSDPFPAGLRVLVVDDDPTCLRILEKMLRNCLYEVTKCSRAEIALKLLRDNKDGFDVVISDVHMPDMDGFKLLEHIGLEMDLPVIMMSADDSKSVVMKGVVHGACDYLIKPVRMEALKNVWQHVVRKKKHEFKERDFEQSGSVDDGARQHKPAEDADYSSSANEGNWKSSKKRKDEEDEAEERDDSSTLKKPRVVWSVELHQQFVTAVNQLGIDKAVPKKILELMNVPGLTRENVASHLQKFRLYLRRLSEQHQNGPFMGPNDPTFGSVASMNGLDLHQALASSGQLPPQSLATIHAASLGRPNNKSPLSVPHADQRNIFSFDNPKIRFIDGQQQQISNSSKQVNLLHGIPTNMDSKQLAALHQSSQPFTNMHAHSQSNQSNSLLTQMVQPQTRPQMFNEVVGNHTLNIPSSTAQPIFSQAIPSTVIGRNGLENVHGSTTYTAISQHPKFPGNSTFPHVSNSGIPTLGPKGMLQGDFQSETKGSRSFLSNYDVFNEMNPKRSDDWGISSVTSTLEAPQHLNVQSLVLVQPGLASNSKNGQSGFPSHSKAPFSFTEGVSNSVNVVQQSTTALMDNSLRIKAEKLPDMGFQNGLFSDQFGQEDLMSALLKQHPEGTAPAVENEFGLDGYPMDNLLV